ncbi:hypothetical protein BRC2024_HCTLARHO_CDS_0012 [Acinetobacter phage vB_AbaS_Silvergun]
MNSKDWHEAPYFAKWRAVDNHGLLTWDEFKPKWNWFTGTWQRTKGLRQLGATTEPGGKESLEARP